MAYWAHCEVNDKVVFVTYSNKGTLNTSTQEQTVHPLVKQTHYRMLSVTTGSHVHSHSAQVSSLGCTVEGQCTGLVHWGQADVTGAG